MNQFDSIDEKQIDHELDVLRDDDDQSIELKDRNGIGISPIVHGPKTSHAFHTAHDREIVRRDRKDQDQSVQHDVKLRK